MPLNNAGIKARREQLGLTMLQAAQAMGWTQRQKWNDFENSRREPRLDTLTAAAKLLRCSVADLIVEEYPPRQKRR